MKVLYIYFILFLTTYIQTNGETFDEIMMDLENLETYIKEYIREKSYTDSSLTHLIVSYIRLGAYKSTEWTIAAGSIPDDLASYISTKDQEKGTTAQKTQKYRDLVLPNGDKIDFVHMFAVMNGIEHGNSYSSNYAHLVGWGGDTEQLLEDIKAEQGDLESLMEIAKTNYFRIKGGFDEADLISDLDAPILLSNKNDNNNFAEIMKNYYNKDENKNRINKFVQLTFPNLVNKVNKEDFRNEIFKIYNDDMFINVLECKIGVRDGFLSCYLTGDIKEQYKQHQKAAVYVVSDYLYDNYMINSESKLEEEETEEEEIEEKEKDNKGEKENISNGNNNEDVKVKEKENINKIYEITQKEVIEEPGNKKDEITEKEKDAENENKNDEKTEKEKENTKELINKNNEKTDENKKDEITQKEEKTTKRN